MWYSETFGCFEYKLYFTQSCTMMLQNKSKYFSNLQMDSASNVLIGDQQIELSSQVLAVGV